MVVIAHCPECYVVGRLNQVKRRMRTGNVMMAASERNRIERELSEQHERGEHET